MGEIAKVPLNGRTMVSTFSGAGGACLGFRMAGYKVAWASEFVEAARDTYKANFGDTYLDPRDIREVKPEEILEQIGMKRGEVDVLEGSPPCASFSLSGRREKNWGDVVKYSETKQRVDDLFFEFVRLVKGIKPKAFSAENVRGLVVGKAKGYFKEILSELKGCGYRTKAVVLDAQWLGVPQRRQRLFFQGIRKDFATDPRFPDPFPYRYNLDDAIGDLVSGRFDIGVRDDVAAGEWQGSFRTPVLDSDPSPTVMAMGIGGVALHTHRLRAGVEPPRRLTIPELKRIMSFPDDFAVTGSYRQQWERMGRSVPPFMAKAVAETIAQTLKEAEGCAG